MVTITNKRLVSSIFVGAIGLILLGIGIGGLASLPSSIASSMAGPNMMGMMAGPMMGGPTSMAGFGMNESLLMNGYMVMMLAIYFGLIAIGSYVIYRSVAPVIKLST